MTTPDPRDERREEVRRIVRAVRAASGPPLEQGAAARIAEGAWARSETSGRAPASRLRLAPGIRRWSVAAAALLTVTLGAFALRPTEPVFAVEGEPVQVWKDDGWKETRRVRPGTVVFASSGVRVLRGRGALEGEAILPDPGTTFRITAQGDAGQGGAGHGLLVELLGGAAEVRGDALRLCVADVEVSPRQANGTLRAWGSLPAMPHDGAPPEIVLDAAREALARVRIRLGNATLLRRSTGERLELDDDEMAALLPVSAEGRTVYRLSRLRHFEPNLGVRIASGHPVLDVRESHEGAIAVLGGPGGAVTGISIDREQLPAALDQIHTAMLAFVSAATGPVEGRVRSQVLILDDGTPRDGIALEARAVATGETLTEVSVTRDGSSVRLLLRGDGSVEIERDGAVSEHPSVDAARVADPAALELLGDYLDR